MTLVFIFSPFKRLGRPLVDFIFIPNSESQLYTLLITKDTWIYFIVAFLNQHKPISVFYISRVPYLPCPLLSFPDVVIQYPSLLWVWTGYFRGCFSGAFTLTLSSPQLLSYVLFVHASHFFPLFHYVAHLRAQNSVSVHTRTVLPIPKCLHWLKCKGERLSVVASLTSPVIVSHLISRVSACDLIILLTL